MYYFLIFVMGIVFTIVFFKTADFISERKRKARQLKQINESITWGIL